MSAIANLRAAPAAFPPLNLQPHGHKKGPHVRSPEDSGGSSDSAALGPAGLRQNLFGSMLNSLEQAIGLPVTAPTSAANGSTNAAAAASTQPATTGPTTGAAADSGGAAASSASAASSADAATANAQASITMLQNYLNNLAHNPRTDGSPAAKFAGSNVSVSA